MAESKRIRVTPNVQKCLAELKEAVKALPQGSLKKRGQRALDYLSKTFAGKPQPLQGKICPKGTPFVGSPVN